MSAPDDGWRYHPKHVEQFPDINKLCNVASCWIYIGICDCVLASVSGHVMYKSYLPIVRRAIVRDADWARADYNCLLYRFLLAAIEDVYGMLTVTYVTLIG